MHAFDFFFFVLSSHSPKMLVSKGLLTCHTIMNLWLKTKKISISSAYNTKFLEYQMHKPKKYTCNLLILSLTYFAKQIKCKWKRTRLQSYSTIDPNLSQTMWVFFFKVYYAYFNWNWVLCACECFKVSKFRYFFKILIEWNLIGLTK